MRRQRRTELCVAKMTSDIANSDVVSKHSAKRVSSRAVLLRCQDGQRGSEYNAPWRAEHGAE